MYNWKKCITGRNGNVNWKCITGRIERKDKMGQKQYMKRESLRTF